MAMSYPGPDRRRGGPDRRNPDAKVILIGHSIYHPERFIHATTIRGPRS